MRRWTLLITKILFYLLAFIRRKTPGLKWQQIIGKGCSPVASQVCYVTENIQPWVQEICGSHPSLKKPLTEGCSSPASRRCCAAGISGCAFQPVPSAGLSRAGCNFCPSCKITVCFQPCHSLLTSPLFCCASKVHLITFLPFSLGVGYMHSLHPNQISGTSILRRLRRRRKHQYFTEHKKLHNSPLLILKSAVVSSSFFFFFFKMSDFHFFLNPTCANSLFFSLASVNKELRGFCSGSVVRQSWGVWLLGKATAGTNESQPTHQAQLLLVLSFVFQLTLVVNESPSATATPISARSIDLDGLDASSWSCP